MSELTDLIDALNRFSDSIEHSRRDEEDRRRVDETRRASRIAEANAQLATARAGLEEARRAYRLGRGGNIAGKVLIPIGIVVTAVSAIGGLGQGISEALSSLGLFSAGGGAVLNFFLCSNRRVQELRERVTASEREVEELEEYLARL